MRLYWTGCERKQEFYKTVICVTGNMVYLEREREKKGVLIYSSTQTAAAGRRLNEALNIPFLKEKKDEIQSCP